jgi:NtrC-family two-component system response regulator AlgB
MKQTEEAKQLQVLIVDDERNIRRTLAVCLQGLGCHVIESGSSAEALAAAERGAFDLVFLDLRLERPRSIATAPRRDPRCCSRAHHRLRHG